MTAVDESLPPRFYKETLPESGKVITEGDLQHMLKDYFRLRGWQ
jgi:aldehyde:ferredoxin oxidoreductase